MTEAICEFRPDAVITFGPDGGYGHPDHVTISATTAACQQAADPEPGPGWAAAGALGRASRLYYRCFPPGDLLIMERLATWLTSRPDRFAGTPAFAHALLVLAEAASTMGHIRDHVQVRWYPPGSCVVEQGEAPAELFVILSGEAEVWQEGNGGRRERLGRLGVGQFFGHRHRSADVVAAASLTCLVLSPAPPAEFAGRGRGARLVAALPAAPADASPAAAAGQAGQGVICCDVSGQVTRKVEALSAYRSQFPLQPGMFPQFLLQERSKPEDPCVTSTALITETTKIVAPEYSHLNCWRRSPADRRYLGTCTASQTSRLARTTTATAVWASPARPVALLARLPLASTLTLCPATAAAPPAAAATASSAPAVTRTRVTRRHRPCGSRPSGNTHSRRASQIVRRAIADLDPGRYAGLRPGIPPAASRGPVRGPARQIVPARRVPSVR